jgi:hypothetical protein
MFDKKGGKVIGSGGFGCIFRPQIKCNASYKTYGENKYDPNGISKVMTRKYGKQEYSELTKFMTIIKTIPNYENYFIMSQITACHPAPFTEEDLIDFDIIKCSGLKKRGINKSTINSYLDELYTINMPYGGDDVDKFVKKYINDIKVIKSFNNKMLLLLENAIIPMNDRGVYHGDLKSANILVEKTPNNIYTRIIDWGLSGIYLSNAKMDTIDSESGFTDDWRKIPDIFRNRPFQYNVPPSSILFSKYFHRHYDKFLLDNNGDLTHLRRFIKEFIDDYIDPNSGHLQNFDSIFDKKIIRKKQHNILHKINNAVKYVSEADTLYIGNIELKINHIDYVYEYIYRILIKYTSNKFFNVIGYFSEVYIHNLDIWGFVMSYYSFMDYPIENQEYKNIIKKLLGVLLTIILEYSSIRIDISLIKRTLNIFNKELSKIKIHNKTQKKR